MSQCKYTIKINGQEVLFNSSQELDNFLAAHIDEYVVDEIDASLHTFSQNDIIQKIQDIGEQVPNRSAKKTVINEDGDVEETADLQGSIGTTSFITTISDPTLETSDDVLNGRKKTLVPAFDKEIWKQTKLAEGWTTERLDNLETSWEYQQECGTEVHALWESIINGTDFTRNLLSEEVEKSLRKQFKLLYNTLLDKHGRDAKFLVEVSIVSKDINPAYKNVQLSDGSNMSSINGRIDLLVIDSSGVAHIYDLKTSVKDVGNWSETRNTRLGEVWHSTKKLTTKYQIAIYAQILRQHGIKVGTVGVIPIKLDAVYDDVDKSIVKDISAAKIPITNNSVDIIGENGIPYDVTISAKVNRILPLTTLVDNVDLAKSIQEPMTKMFPNYEVELQVQRSKANIETLRRNERIVVTISPTSPEAQKGKWVVHDYGRNVHTYCKTEEDVTQALEALIAYENENRANELTSLAQGIMDIQEGTRKFEDLYTNDDKVSYLRMTFSKYIDGGWKFQNNPSFIAAGMFVFERNGLLEIVSLTQNDVHYIANLGMGTTILGATKPNYAVDENKYIKATNGNIDLMKVMCFLNSNTELLENYQINNIVSRNIWRQTGTDMYSDILLHNFRKLCEIHKIKLNLEERHFTTILQSTVSTIKDLCGDHLINTVGMWEVTFDPNDVIHGTDWLLEKVELLKHLPNGVSERLNNAIKNGKYDFSDPVQYSYMLLLRALDKLNGHVIHMEPDVAPWIDTQGKWSAGAYLTSPGLSPSKNIQTMAQIKSIANNKVTEEILRYEPRLRKVLEAFYKSKSRNQFTGNEIELFDNLFVRDVSNNIDPSFRLKDPKDTSLSKEESDFITMFLEIVNDLKYNGNIDQIEKAKVNGTYYEVPLAMGSTTTLLHNNAVTDVIKEKYREDLNVLRLFAEEERRLNDVQQAGVAFNRFHIDGTTRHKMLSKYGPAHMETQLEKLLRNVISAYVTERVMTDVLPQIAAIKVVLQYQNWLGVSSENTSKFIDDYVKLNIYNKPIMDQGLHRTYKIFATIRDLTTTTALAFNYRSGMRELLQGVWIHVTRSMADVYGENRLKRANLAKAWSFIFKDSLHNPNDVTLLDLLNISYNMANADILQLQERLSMSQTGMRNFGSDQMFIFNKIPDIYHRMGILIAIMMEDGCWEAHFVKDNRLVYDFHKDKRFDLLFKQGVDKNSKKYKDQHSLYTAMRLQFNKEGYNLVEGDALPRAYTVQEGTSIKSFSDQCFGHYDKDQQMMAKHQFIGAFMLHFKTFLSAKLETWILKPGTYNQGTYKVQYTEDGEELLKIYSEDVDGKISVRIGTKSDIKPNEYYESYREWEGRFMEGILWSMLDYGKAIYKLDMQELKRMWNNPTKRANFILFIEDMLFASLLLWILSAWMEDEDRDPSTFTHFIELSTYNAIGEAPFTATIQGMFGDLNPPMVNTAKNLFSQMSAVLTGDKNLFDAAINSFGALGDVRYAINNLA